MIKLKNTFFGHIDGGELKIENLSDWSARIHKLEGEQVVLKIDKRKKIRSLAENAYFHGVVLPILGDELGHTPEEMKGIVKWVFKVKHTSELSTVEFEDLMAKVRQWASIELGIYLPAPNDDIPSFFIQ